MGLLLSIFFGFVPMFLFAAFIYWLDPYEKEPRKLLIGVFFWGALVAAGGAFIINTAMGVGILFITGSEGATELTTGSLVAPFVEEILKGLAVLGVFLFSYREFDSVLDGIVYASIAAMGFAATENAYYIYSYGFLEDGYIGLFSMVFVRVILVGWQHPFYTAFFGIGLAIARLNRSVIVKILAPLGGLAVSMFTHSFHNTFASIVPGIAGLFAGTFIDWSGWFFMLIFIIVMIIQEQKILTRYLKEEIDFGLISRKQFDTAVSSWQRWMASISAFGTSSARPTREFYQLLADLAHKKRQFVTLGEESGNSAIIADLRTRIQSLAPLAKS